MVYDVSVKPPMEGRRSTPSMDAHLTCTPTQTGANGQVRCLQTRVQTVAFTAKRGQRSRFVYSVNADPTSILPSFNPASPHV